MGVWTVLLAGFGVWLLIEGALCALAPDYMRRLGQLMSHIPLRDLALGGLVVAAVGASLLILAVLTA